MCLVMVNPSQRELGSFTPEMPAGVCAAVILFQLDTLGKHNSDLIWEDLARRYNHVSKGIEALGGALKSFDGVVEDYQVPVLQTTRHGLVEVPKEWQRANCIHKISSYFVNAQPITRDFLSIMLIARAKNAGLSLSEALRSQMGEYEKLAGEILTECGIDESYPEQLSKLDLVSAVKNFLQNSLNPEIVAA